MHCESEVSPSWYAHGTHAGPAGDAAHGVPRQKPKRYNEPMAVSL